MIWIFTIPVATIALHTEFFENLKQGRSFTLSHHEKRVSVASVRNLM